MVVVGVALKLGPGVAVGNCGFMEARWATSGMMEGCVSFVTWGYFDAGGGREYFNLVYQMHR